MDRTAARIMPTEDVAPNHLESDGSASASPEPEPPALPRSGHAAKILEAVKALRAEGKLPPNLRPMHFNKRVQDWLRDEGYEGDIPDRNAIHRVRRRFGL
jgi:hypothetical protein